MDSRLSWVDPNLEAHFRVRFFIVAVVGRA